MANPYYYKHADNTYSNFGYSDKMPSWEPEPGGQWCAGEPKDLEPKKFITFDDVLDLIDTTLRTLPEESQAKFSPKFPEILLLLQRKNYSTALLVFKNIETDTDAEAAIKKQISEILGAFL